MNKKHTIVVLTGAGVSAESGVATFRASDGLWEDHRIEDVATPEAFERDAELVLRFYNERRQPFLNDSIAPNAGHFALAKLARESGNECFLITQNIDDLHERAGSENVRHMHGSLFESRCIHCEDVAPCYRAMNSSDACGACQKIGGLRPNIVWFGEMPFYMDEIYAALKRCDVLLAIGTSGVVYPAAGFAQLARQGGARTIEFNLEASAVASDFIESVYGAAGETLPLWVDQYLAGS